MSGLDRFLPPCVGGRVPAGADALNERSSSAILPKPNPERRLRGEPCLGSYQTPTGGGTGGAGGGAGGGAAGGGAGSRALGGTVAGGAGGRALTS